MIGWLVALLAIIRGSPAKEIPDRVASMEWSAAGNTGVRARPHSLMALPTRSIRSHLIDRTKVAPLAS